MTGQVRPPIDPATVTVVIPTYNEAAFIARCLRSIFGLELPESIKRIEAVVVDNESTDPTPELARQLGARVVTTPASTIAASRNLGASRGSGGWVAFVDADCELPPAWLLYAARHFESTEIVAMGAKIARPPESATWVERGWFEIGERHPRGSHQEVDWLPTSNLIVKRACFDTVGGFAGELVTCEDSDLGYRLSKVGKLILEYRVETVHHRDSKTLLELFRREAWRARGNLVGIEHHGILLAELPSLLIPILFVLGLLSLPAVLVLSPWLDGRLAGLFWLGPAAAVVALLLPVLMLLRSRALTRVPVLLPALYMIAATYLLARGVGPFYDFRRLSK